MDAGAGFGGGGEEGDGGDEEEEESGAAERGIRHGFLDRGRREQNCWRSLRKNRAQHHDHQHHPHKALFISYTISSSSSSDDEDSTVEISQISATETQTPLGFFAVYRTFPPRYYHRSAYFTSAAAATEPLSTTLRLPAGVERPSLPRSDAPVENFFGISRSLQDRAKDVLMVVAGLLFGIGCGALTSATMYLAWSLVNSRYESCRSEEFYYDEEEEEEDVESPKKMGYVDLPPAPASPVSPIKEGYGGM